MMAGALAESENHLAVLDASMGALVHAVHSEYHANDHKDKRMLLLYQFLEFLHAKETLKKAPPSSTEVENVFLYNLQKVSWFVNCHYC